MAPEGDSLSADAQEAETEKRHKQDAAILKLFALVTLVIFSVVLVAQILLIPVDTEVLSSSVMAGFATAIYVVGILEYKRYRRNGRLPRKRSFKLMLLAATVLWAILLVIVAVALAYPGEDFIVDRPIQSLGIGAAAIVAVALYIASLFSVALMVLLAFGAVGLVSAVTRRFTPLLLAAIRGISGKQSPRWKDRALAWVFGIPDTIDTRTLRVTALPSQDSFPRRAFTQAVLWELVLGIILAVYVAFNPLLTSGSSESIRLLGTLQTAAIVVPLVMIPWFVYTSVDATIKGATKDFRLYDGIKARIFRSYIAVGTLVVFVRMSLTTTDLGAYALDLVGYVSALLAAATLFTFVYYNYFDREMTVDIIAVYNRLLEKK
jgi:hypothetical protein